MSILSRDDILRAADLPTEEVHVPEWGGSVLVRGMTGAERDAFESSVVELKAGNKATSVNMQNIRAKLVALTVVDEKGERLFSQADVELLGNKSAAALQRIFEAAQRLSGLTQADVEELAKN
jgi:hypothetical protein